MKTASHSVIVIGGGTAGCTVVSHLAAHTEAEILLLEPGPVSHHDDESRFFEVLQHSSHFDMASDGYLQAQMLGGGSAINGMLLTGEEPRHLHGLTRVATADECGVVGQSLLKNGGRHSHMWWNGGRWNPGRAVHHLEEEGRITVLPRRATEILMRDGRVIGVDCNDEPLFADAIVLCAGALVTPSLLLASGLHEVNSHIGLGLQNHPTVTALLPLRHPNTAFFDASVVREWTSTHNGKILNIAYERASHVDEIIGMLSVSLMNPVSRGSVSINDGSTPSVDFALLRDDADMVNMLEAVHDLLGLLTTKAFADIVVVEEVSIEGTSLNAVQNMSDTELREWLYASIQMVSHASSSCALAVDQVGRVNGVRNLWVADASILPSVPHCTPAAPVTMEALRIARNIGESLK